MFGFGKKEKEIHAPVDGELIQINQVNDPVFSTKAMGEGFAIDPSNGKIFSPIKGTVTSIFPTKHAIGLVDKDGLEVLIHIGIDTVQLDGQYFTSHVSQGDSVKQGQLLMEFDMEAIKAAGYEVQTPIIVTNSTDYQVDPLLEEAKVTNDEKILIATQL